MPEAEHAMIEAAYRFGNLGQGIRSAIELRTHVAAIKRAIRGAILYPIALIGGLTLFFWYMSTTVFPGYHEALPMDRWPSSGVEPRRDVGLRERPHAGALQRGSRSSSRSSPTRCPAGPVPRGLGSTTTCPRGRSNRIVYGTVFLLGLSGYLNASMNPTEVLGYTIKDANPWYAEKVRAILRHVQNGKNLGDAMSLSPYKFPSYELIEDLRVYAQYKDIAVVLDEQAKEILEDSINRIKSQAVVVRNVADTYDRALLCSGSRILASSTSRAPLRRWHSRRIDRRRRVTVAPKSRGRCSMAPKARDVSCSSTFSV